jgi:hypothetical protein
VLVGRVGCGCGCEVVGVGEKVGWGSRVIM